MRSLLLLFAFAACASTARGPAWPKSSAGSGDDGGESLAPRPSAHELAKAEPVAGDDAIVIAADKPAEKPVAAAPEAAPAVTPPAEEPATTEEITIEIDDE